MEFPYGKAPLVILLIALASGAWLLARGQTEVELRRPDLVLATFAKDHAEAYKPLVDQFEKRYGVHVQIQFVDQKALQDRLQSALRVGADVPDMVELLYGTMGLFTRGPIADVGFRDLTGIVRSTGLYDQLVTSRFSKWSSRGHIFALPHDLHPVMLCYRRDLVEELGIDVTKLTTWDEFCRVGRAVVAKTTGPDGITKHYMLDLPRDGNDQLRILLEQHGGDLFDDAGNVTFDDEKGLDVICWYAQQVEGQTRISFPCGDGQSLYMCMNDGLALFYWCPDWRTASIMADAPSLSGKLSLIPLPAWEPGGRRTSTYGGTGLAFTKPCRDFDLAWKLAMYLYYDPDQLGQRYAETHILPPVKAAWTQPQFYEHVPFFSDLPMGRVYAALAPDVPAEHDTAYTVMALNKFAEAFTNTAIYYSHNGATGMRDYARRELKSCADRIRVIMARNVFLRASAGAAQ
jgi:arabinosaccharide transport system substrate-binding protein